MSIPLVQNNEKDSINTSIIAIKKNLERINSILGLMDNSDPDLSGLATKQELENAVTEINDTIDEVETSLQPVDTVTSGDMHSVTSNAVYGAFNAETVNNPIASKETVVISVRDCVAYKIQNIINIQRLIIRVNVSNGFRKILVVKDSLYPRNTMRMTAYLGDSNNKPVEAYLQLEGLYIYFPNAYTGDVILDNIMYVGDR